MGRATRTITSSTALIGVPRDAPERERAAYDALALFGDEDFVEVTLPATAQGQVTARFPAALLRRYLEAQDVPGRELMVFDSDEEVSSEVAARMLGVSRPFLNELLDVEAIDYRRVGNQRRIRVVDLDAYRKRRQQAQEGLARVASIVEESSGGWGS